MTSKTATSLAFAAGCLLAFGAMPAAHAQSAMPSRATAENYYAQQSWDRSAVQPQPYAGQPYGEQAYGGEPYYAGTRVETNGPQASRGDFGDWSARRNNIESAHYDRLLQASPGFRHARMRKECGPISDPQLREQCMASFQQYEPVMYGSSLPPREYRYHRHYRRMGY